MADQGDFKILSIDGGGIRGLIPAILLQDLERRLHQAGKDRPLCTYFHLMAGTSSGGINACALACPSPVEAGRPAMTPDQLVALYRQQGATIFSRDTFRRIREALLDPRSILQERYDAAPLEALLQQTLGLRRVSEALTRVLIPAYDIEARRTIIFEPKPAEQREDYYFWQAARATAAAPTYFEPARVRNLATGQTLTLIDGGVFANDPGLCAYVEAIKAGAAPDQILLVSLGTGYQNRPFSYRDVRDWGPWGWINPRNGAPIISILMQGQSYSTAYQLNQVMNRDGRRNYYRFDAELTIGNDELDDASATNLTALEFLARQIIASHDTALNEIVQRL